MEQVEVMERCRPVVMPVHEYVIDGAGVFENRGQCILEEACNYGGIPKAQTG